MSSKINIAELQEKFWNGETSLEEEKLLKSHFAEGESNDGIDVYFQYLSTEKALNYAPKKQVKVVRMNTTRRVMAIAASLIVLVSGYFFIQQNHTQDNVYYAQTPEEALEITKNALSVINNNVNKGNSLIFNNLNEYNKVNLFK